MTPIAPKNFVNMLFMLVKTAQIHDPNNQALKIPLDHFLHILEDLMSQEPVVRLEAIETNLYLNEEKIRTDISTFTTFKYFREEFKRKQVGGIVFLKVPTAEELIEFAHFFTRAVDRPQSGAEKLNQILATKQVHSIEYLEFTEKRTVPQSATRPGNPKQLALKNYVKAVDIVKDCANKIYSNQTFETRKAKRIVYNLVDICLDEGFSFAGLSNIKNYDEYTFNHSVNVCIIAIEFGKNLGLTKRQLGELGVAALFHDYGKLAIPREILNKPGSFDAQEWAVMKTHPVKAIRTLLATKGFQETDIKKLIAAFEHHRNYDCTGYPQTGINKPMNFYSKVVAIADAYDAMTTNRVYQPAILPTEALKTLMDHAGTKFDPLLVKAFVNTVGIYPVGTVLRMKSGEIAIVTSANTDPAKLALPKVRIIADAQGKFSDEGLEIDLSQEQEQPPGFEIQTVLRPENYRINVVHYLFKDALENDASPPPAG